MLKPNRENRLLETRRLDPISYHHNLKLLHKSSIKKCTLLVPIREMFPSHLHNFTKREAPVMRLIFRLLHHNWNLIQAMLHWARSHLSQFMEVQAIVITHFLDLMLVLQPHLSNSNPMIHRWGKVQFFKTLMQIRSVTSTQVMNVLNMPKLKRQTYFGEQNGLQGWTLSDLINYCLHYRIWFTGNHQPVESRKMVLNHRWLMLNQSLLSRGMSNSTDLICLPPWGCLLSPLYRHMGMQSQEL